MRKGFPSFFEHMTGQQRLFAFVFIISVMSILIASWTEKLPMISVAIILILWLTKTIWLPHGYGTILIRRISLGIVSLVATSSLLWGSILESVLLKPLYVFLQRIFPFFHEIPLPNEDLYKWTLLFVLIGVFIVNFFTRDNTVMRELPATVENEFPEKNFKHLRHELCISLKNDIEKLNKELNWNEQYYTSLEAEVAVVKNNKKEKRICDLLAALRSDTESKIFLLLGDPGSGKSLALRKLCFKLLNEVSQTNKVPIYINLKEWEIPYNLTVEPLPSSSDIYKSLNQFVLKNLKERLWDRVSEKFLDRYFEPMLENGMFFIILDSFDEIPAVLDANESSQIIRILSDVIYRFIGGTYNSRGVLASRYFRKPTDSSQEAKALLEIRPFTESKIRQTLENSLSYSPDKLIKKIFKDRPEFVPLARNPFTISLITNYANNNQNKLSENQYELFTSYLNDRLAENTEYYEKYHVTQEEVIETSSVIAEFMFTNPKYGLEAPVEEIIKNLPDYNVEATINILIRNRLGRVGSSYEKRFSFVHRRFSEYFVAKRLIENPNEVNIESIANDARWRDVLVLYCELADKKEAERIALFCWSEIEKITIGNVQIGDSQFIRGIHCLRFLTEAFRSRLECISSFRNKLATFIDQQIKNKENLLEIKLAVEAVGLLENEQIDDVIIKSFHHNNEWINETAFKSCRHLPELSDRLQDRLKRYIDSIQTVDFYIQKKDLLFSLSLSNGFHAVLNFCRARVYDIQIVVTTLFGVLIVSPTMIIALCILALIYKSIFLLIEIGSRKHVSPPTILEIPNIIRINAVLIIITSAFSGNFTDPSKIDPLSILLQITNETYISGGLMFSIFLLFILLMIPWYQIKFYIPLVIKNWEKKYWILLLILALSPVPFVIIKPVVEQLPVYVTGFLFLLALCTIFIVLMVTILRGWISYHRDVKNLKRLSFHTDFIDRRLIEEHLSIFQTSRGRFEYTKKLFDQNLPIRGSWSNGRVPYFTNESASTELAKLEEKSLGFAR
ncbi:NACHT domain-containing protein [Cohnella luojiensis]|uniref:NACHT domain-containing protein n=1 Tax=Cohnella luojiensis TaxID=652876 RepID=A0A4Y8LP21_9BACL|nr:NACHT domain-containing protein [Cohnella luojiensis]TFE19429.1 NACHT domain-containing protein [Cohnella luojiensis]